MQEKISQRERNFRETWSAIHEAAFTLAIKDQSPHATVEGIADAAGISRRTFFNYFASKEDAILGVKSPRLTQEMVTSYAGSAEGQLSRAVHLLLAVVQTSMPPEGFPRRKQAVEAIPGLRVRLNSLLAEGENLVRELLLNRVEEFPLRDERLIHSEGEELDALLALAVAVLKQAVNMRYDRQMDLEPLIPRTIESFRKVMERC